MARVTIVGAGNMGRGIGTRAVAGGHQVEIIDRDQAEAQKLASELGEHATALEPGASLGGDIIVFAAYYPGIKDAVQEYGDQLAGKVVVDITNPIDVEAFEPPEARGRLRGTGDRRQGARGKGRQGVQHHVRRHAGRGKGRRAAARRAGRLRRRCRQADRQPPRERRRPAADRRRSAPPRP